MFTILYNIHALVNNNYASATGRFFAIELSRFLFDKVIILLAVVLFIDPIKTDVNN